MSQTLSPSFARCYGLARVARVWNDLARQRLSSLKETQPNTTTASPWSGRRMFGRGTRRPSSAST